jgi:hypothetical protein
MSEHPYKDLPQHCFWRGSIAGVPVHEVDPVVSARFRIAKTDRVVTAGSCFAQHIARHLQKEGFSYFVTETAHPLIGAHLVKDYGYGVFSARYGNIYTSRQLLQLLQRAYGLFQPQEDAWPRADGRIIDPFRPQIQPNGFASWPEFRADRAQHFRAVRQAVEQMAVFVFTLGLTEAWCARADGAAYPLCPGVAGGTFDPSKYAFVNLGVQEVIADLGKAIDFIRAKNPAARVILTVSPVPLAATAEDRSVLVSTMLSKSVLRVAAEEIAGQRDYVAYFPSYEIVTGSYTRGAYFGEDLRSVTEAGVDHVMRLFMKHYASGTTAAGDVASSPREPAADPVEAHFRDMQRIADVICEEELLGMTR